MTKEGAGDVTEGEGGVAVEAVELGVLWFLGVFGVFCCGAPARNHNCRHKYKFIKK